MNTPASLLIEPLKPFDVTLRPPGSKSLTNRALLLAALGDGPSKLTGVLFADDSRRMLEALQELGFQLDLDEDACTVTVHGQAGVIPSDAADLHLGNAGTAMRFLTAALCLGGGEYTLDGIERMRQRPIGELVEPLRQLGANIEYLGDDGCPPLKISGGTLGLAGGSVELQPTLSSQFISALLIAGRCTGEGVDLRFDGKVTSLPYVKMTLKVMKKFGGKSKVVPGYKRVRVLPGPYHACDYEIEPDASNASYFLAAAAVVPGSRCVIEGLGSESLQGDAAFCDVLGRMGCGVEQQVHRTTVTSPADGKLRGVDVDLNDMPDMAQTLAVVAVFAEGPTTIRNVGNLRVKETDRITALENELVKLGATVDTIADDITITPPPPRGSANGSDRAVSASQNGSRRIFEGASGGASEGGIDTYDDHRMAMAFAVAGLRLPGVVINDPACVNKTFPNYFEVLDRLRAAAV